MLLLAYEPPMPTTGRLAYLFAISRGLLALLLFTPSLLPPPSLPLLVVPRVIRARAKRSRGIRRGETRSNLMVPLPNPTVPTADVVTFICPPPFLINLLPGHVLFAFSPSVSLRVSSLSFLSSSLFFPFRGEAWLSTTEIRFPRDRRCVQFLSLRLQPPAQFCFFHSRKNETQKEREKRKKKKKWNWRQISCRFH